MNGAQWVVHALRTQGVDTVFGYPGGAIMPVYDALYDGGVEHLLCRHEQGAAMAAIGYARATGKTGVCIATSGPGATNLITGLADGNVIWCDVRFLFMLFLNNGCCYSYAVVCIL